MRATRIARGMGLGRLASLASLPAPFVRALESGHVDRLHVRTLGKLAKALGTTVGDLAGEAGFPLKLDTTDAVARHLAGGASP